MTIGLPRGLATSRNRSFLTISSTGTSSSAPFLDELFFLSGRPQPTATAAHQRMLDIIEQQPSLLAFGPTCTLRSALMYLIEQGETRAIRLARKHRDLAGDHVADALARRDRG